METENGGRPEKKDPEMKAEKIWNEYQESVSYNQSIGLYDTAEENENFYLGNQWVGVDAPDLPKPVLNFLKRVVMYFNAMLVSDDIGMSMTPYVKDLHVADLVRTATQDVDRLTETLKLKTKNREVLRNCAVDGDGCLYFWFDPDVETGYDVKGEIRAEIVRNINCLFGNPWEPEAQEQPYMMIVQRRMVKAVREEAERNGVKDVESIVPDDDTNQMEDGDGNELCTVVNRLWKVKGNDGVTVHAVRSTKTHIIREEWDTGYRLYPIAWIQWDKVPSSYHGRAAITGLIPNQIMVNKLFAMTILSVMKNAFPKTVYDLQAFPQGWSNKVGESIGISANNMKVAERFAVLRGGDVSTQVMDVIDRCIQMTRDFLGASDAALGNVKPDNTSAIIAVQQAAAVPLDLNKYAFYDFVEQYIWILIDMMRAHYGVREVEIDKDPAEVAMENETTINAAMEAVAQPPQMKQTDVVDARKTLQVDYSEFSKLYAKLNVNVGSSAYWSELTQMQTMDNLLSKGIMQDIELYIESIPDKYLPNKAKIIESVRKQQQQMENLQVTDPDGIDDTDTEETFTQDGGDVF